MKTTSPELEAELKRSHLTLSVLLLIERSDGVVLGFTDHDRPLTYDLGLGHGPIEFRASLGFTRAEVNSSAALSTDTTELDGLFAVIDDDAITESDLRAGRYAGAEARMAVVNWADLSQGHLALPGDVLGEISWADGVFHCEVRGLGHWLQQAAGEVTTQLCRADFGDERCGYPVEPAVWTASTDVALRHPQDARQGATVRPVTGGGGLHFEATQAGTTGEEEPDWPTTVGATVADGTTAWRAIRPGSVETTVTGIDAARRVFTVGAAVTDPPDWHDRGSVRFLDGELEGLRLGIRRWDPDELQVELSFDAPLDFEVGDAVRILAGCAKDEDACVERRNIHNVRAEFDLPGMDAIMALPVTDEAGVRSSGKLF